jgi:hypothetical protein
MRSNNRLRILSVTLPAFVFSAIAALASHDADAATQCVNQNAPAPLEYCVQDDTTPSAWVQQPNGRVAQYFNNSAWGSNAWLNGTDTSKHYKTSYYSNGTGFTPVSNTKTGTGTSIDPYVITTVVDLGATGVRLTQQFFYVNGDRSIRKVWSFSNTGSTSFTDLRFFHGGDTTFGGDDSARSWYDSSSQMVYVTNSAFTNSGYMGFSPNPGTPIAAYFSGNYSTGRQQAQVTAALNNTANSTYQDGGYQLQWNRATFSPGQTWAIEAFEYWSPPGSLQAFAPSQSYVTPSNTVRKQFKVQNLDPSNSASITLSIASGTNSWFHRGQPVERPRTSRSRQLAARQRLLQPASLRTSRATPSRRRASTSVHRWALVSRAIRRLP